MTVELAGPYAELRTTGCRLEEGRERGWGGVSIPADANPADDDFYFVFDNPPPRRTVIVCEDPQVAASAGTGGFDRARAGPALPRRKSLDVDQLASVDWDEIGLIVWQASLPTGAAARRCCNRSSIEGAKSFFFRPAIPRQRRTVRRPLARLGRRMTTAFPLTLGAVTRMCWRGHLTAPRCRWDNWKWPAIAG